MGRVLVISLDGYEPSIAEEMMAAGQLPALSRLRDRSARFLLEHGSALRTGLGSEHFSSGMSPRDAKRSSAIYFDKTNYRVVQEGPKYTPFPFKMNARTVTFDLPYFDLKLAPNVRGIAAWGAHDSGTEFSTNPPELGDELLEKFGTNPASKSMYAIPWPSRERCKTVGAELVKGVELRSKIALWLLKERLSDWDLALIGVSEAHSAIEAFWHGYDKKHPLHQHVSASVAGRCVKDVYEAIDRLVASLMAAFEDATIVVFSMHGMGPNQSDVASMALLPELLYRQQFGTPFIKQPSAWSEAAGGLPILDEKEGWHVETSDVAASANNVRSLISPYIPKRIKKYLKRLIGNTEVAHQSERQRSLGWMPAARFQAFWPKMRAFALPSFYDGRIRINLKGRERNGLVPLERYEAACEEVANLLRDCRDPMTGDGIVSFIEYENKDQPLSLDPMSADMTVVWKGAALAFEHPSLGKIGPLPFRRTGGHTGPYGMAFVAAQEIAPGDYGKRSSFDVVPTLFELLDETVPREISGHSLLAS